MAVLSLHKQGKILYHLILSVPYSLLIPALQVPKINNFEKYVIVLCCRTKTGKLKTSYKHENVSANADFDLSLSAGPLVNASTVVGYQGKEKITCIYF